MVLQQLAAIEPLLKHQGASSFRIVELPLAGFRRLRFSFFADEHAPGALRLCDCIRRLRRMLASTGPAPFLIFLHVKESVGACSSVG